MAVNFSEKQIEKKAAEMGKSQTQEKKSLSLMDKINDFLLKLSRVPLKERLFFVQHLGVMLKAGISLGVALKTLSKQSENKFFVKILSDVSDKVDKGSSFAESLMPYKKIFGEMFINMVEAGELSGKLEEVLHELFIQMKKEHALISKVKGALTYPTVILFAMGGIGTFMMVKVVPQITVMFKEMDAELPLATKILINVSDGIANNGILTVLIFVTVVSLFIYIIKTPKGKYIFQGILLKTPVFGAIIKKINMARFARNISSLLKTDIMIIQCFQITASVLGNLHYRAALEEMAQKIKKGGKLNEVVNAYPKLFTPVVAQMISVGEETGELDNILMELAEFYEEEVDNIMESLPSIIEPLLMLILGLGVGAIAIAIMMPMYSLSSQM
jgi:type IV pilus assembly protein PilC